MFSLSLSRRATYTSVMLLLASIIVATTTGQQLYMYEPSKFNEVWDTASEEPGQLIDHSGWDSTPVLTVNGSQPIGNGDLTAAAYPELDKGAITIWLSKQDAISDDTMPFKLAQVSLSVEPNPWAENSTFFRQTLDLSRATVVVLAGGTGEGDYVAKFEAWVDISSNVAHLTAVAGPGAQLYNGQARAFAATATITALHPTVAYRPYSGTHYMTCDEDGDPLTAPDVLMEDADTGPNTIAIYHRNLPDEVMIDAALSQQKLASLRGTAADPARSMPLANRTFGVAVAGYGLSRTAPIPSPAGGAPGAESVLKGNASRTEWHVAVAAVAMPTLTVAEWYTAASTLLAEHMDDGQATSPARLETTAHWRSFWNRSHIDILTTPPPTPLPAPPAPPGPELPGCGTAAYCRKNTTLDSVKQDMICAGDNDNSNTTVVPCAGIDKEWCPNYKNISQRCIEVAQASCNITTVNSLPCLAFAIFEDWGVEYYSTRAAGTHTTHSYAWTYFYRNPAVPFRPAPPQPTPPSPSAIGMVVSQNYALTRYVHAVQSRMDMTSDLTGAPRLPIKFNGESFT